MIAQAIAMAGAGMQASAALAACPGTVNAPTTATCTLNAGQAATITSTGSINVAGANTQAIVLNGTGTTVNNSGLLQGTEAAIDQFVAGTVNITNNAGATIAGIRTNSGSAVGISLVSLAAGSTLTNAGTITGSVTGSDSASAYGIYIGSSVAAALTNSGTINATATANSSASAYGIYVSSGGIAATGSITNSGTINATANATDSAYAAGIDVFGGVANGGSISNTGTINATASSTDTTRGTAHADGIVLSGTLNGTLTNSGTINASATAAHNAEAHGIYVSTVAAGATLTNSGHITASAAGLPAGSSSIPAPAIFASAVGILIGSGTGGTLTNSGTITATATASAANGRAQAGGIYVSGTSVSGPISNSGTITATANAASNARAGGIASTTATLSAAITNSGTIHATATTTGTGFGTNAQAGGIAMRALVAGSITNAASGSITADATAAKHGASANAVHVGNADSKSSLSNAGTISASATAQSTGASGFAQAYGMRADTLQGSMSNSGTISVLAHDGGEGAVALGMAAFSMASGSSITNSGTINITGQPGLGVSGTGASTEIAAGIFVGHLPSGATVTNSGTINATSATATTGESAEGAVGIYVRTLQAGATLTNSGTINANTTAANGAGAGWAMFVRFGATSEGARPTVVNSGTLNGNVFLSGTSLNNSGTLSIPIIGAGYATQGSTVGGNYTQLPGGVLQVGAFSASEYGKLEVGGTADFTANGHLAVNVTPVNALAKGDVLDNVVHAGTLVDGNGSVLFVTDNSAMWDFTAIDDGANGIDLTVLQALSLPQAVIQNGPKWALPAATAMQTVINAGTASGDMASVIAELGSLGTSQQLSAASAQLVPVIAGQSSQQANLAMDELSSIVMGRLDALRATGLEGSHDKNLWVRPFATNGKQDPDKGYPGYDFHSYGAVVGYDTNVGSNWNVGGALAYSEPQVNSDTPWFDHGINVNAYQASLYGYWDAGNHSFVDTLLIGGYNDNHANRRITFGGINDIATGNYDGYYGRAAIAAGHAFQMTEHAQFVPSLNVAYTYISEDSYTETGAGALDLQVDSNNASSLVVGADAAFTYTADTTVMTIHAGGGYDTLTDQVDLGAAFVGGGPKFKTTGPEPEKWLVRAGVGFQVAPTSQLDLHFTYDYEYRDTFSNNLLTATARFKL